jgi:iron complex outermembrane receptor protein
MGARNLLDVLQTVPGMNAYYNTTGEHETYARGLTSLLSQRILLMINSQPLNENFTGGAMGVHATLMLDNVKRIEFIRGPGSAVYGANAFAGVINVITREAEDIDGWELIARGGSYDTQQYNILYGKTFNDLDIVFNYNYFNTHGFNGHVNEDFQTFLDQLVGTNASLAPGRMKGDDEKFDASLNLQYKGLTFDGKYVDREKDLPVGLFPTLNNRSTFSHEDYYLNLSYERTLWEAFDLYGKVYRHHNSFDNYFQTLPPGALLNTPSRPVVMEEGIISIPSAKNKRTGFELQATYRIAASNTLLAGVTYEEMKQYDGRWRANFLNTDVPNLYIPLPSVGNVSDVQALAPTVKRNFKAFFIENIWDITDNLRLTTSVRYDDYSDFGSEVSPRAGITWEFIKGYNLKLLYGHAFRAPSFQELYDQLLGDPDLDPETIDTYEVSLGAEFTPSLSSRITWFRSRIKDAIGQTFEQGPDWQRYRNFDTQRSEGLEVEMRYDFGRGTYLTANYTYQLFKKRALYMIPRYMGNVMANIRLSKYLNFYTSCHFEDGFRRNRGDPRDDMSGYGIVDTTLIAKKFLKGYEGLEVRGSVYNLFDKDYTSPFSQQIPNDIPRPGRSFLVGVRYKF